MHVSRSGSLRAAIVLAILAVLSIQPAAAQSGRPMRVIVPFPPGGSADVLARVISAGLGDAAQQPIVVENHPGAGASIAYDLTARAVPDGNLVVVGSNSLVINPLLRKVNYDSVASFTPVCNLVASPMIFVVNQASSYKSIGDLIAAAHNKPATRRARTGNDAAHCRREFQARQQEQHHLRAVRGRRADGERAARAACRCGAGQLFGSN